MPDRSVIFEVHVKPRASTTRLVSHVDGVLTIELNAPPIDNKANKALIEFLAKTLRVPKSQIAIQSGKAERKKLIRFDGVLRDDLISLLDACFHRQN